MGYVLADCHDPTRQAREGVNMDQSELAEAHAWKPGDPFPDCINCRLDAWMSERARREGKVVVSVTAGAEGP